jgi:hypothetical protein
MSTRSIIAVPHGDGWKGRYAHWDGYPEWMGRALWEIVQRDGIDAARRTLAEDNFYWSNVNPSAVALDEWQQDGRFRLVPGYGITGTSEQAKDEWIYSTDFDYWGTEYVYVLCDSMLMVGAVNGGWQTQASVTWLATPSLRDIEPDWANLSGAVTA